VLDGTINASMQPFRALVADNLPEEQKSQGFAIQSLFIGLGGTVASALPWMLTNWGGVTGGSTAGSAIPASVRISFYIGAVAFLGAVLWSVLKTVEYPPAADELVALRARKFDWSLGLGEVLALVGHLPRRMWELGLVQFFTWIGMFCMWVYFSPAIAAGVFHAAKGSPEMTAAGDWTGICFGMYNAVCFLFSFVLLWATRFTGPKVMHALCLAVGAAGLAAVHLASGKNELLLSMIAVGVAWASILSMPYAMLAPALPRQQVGVMMGMFNLFIVFPQIAFSALGDSLFKSVLHSDPMNALLLGGGCLGVSALLTLVVVSFRSSETGAELPSGGTGH
jgi:maltose/moltooligosaccharide transporter